jgi:hypothetical protein
LADRGLDLVEGGKCTVASSNMKNSKEARLEQESSEREVVLERLENQLKHNGLLQFQHAGMEAQFSLCHNQLLRSADTLCIAVSVSFVCLSIFRTMFLKEFEQVGPRDWMRCLLFPILNQSVRTFCPKAWRRYRELFWCADRFERLYATSLPGAWVFRCEDASIFAYGAGTSLLDAVGHKVRFHIQVLLSAVMYGVSIPIMVSNHMRGVFHITPTYLMGHFLVTAMLPGALVYLWDWHIRCMFVGAKLNNSD